MAEKGIINMPEEENELDDQEADEEENNGEEAKDDSKGYSNNRSSGRIFSFVIILIICLVALYFLLDFLGVDMSFIGNAGAWIIALLIILVLASSIRINSQWDEAIILRLGKYNRKVKEGLYFKIPLFEKAIKRDMRVKTQKLPKQEAMTKDNISVFVESVLFLKIKNAKDSILNIENYDYAMMQQAQISMRTLIGQNSLDDLLSKRQEIAKNIKEDIAKHISNWGIEIISLEIQDISLPENMKRVMARQAEAEREKRGVIIASEGEVIAAKNLASASNILTKSKYGIKLRELTTIKDVSSDGNTVIFYPTEMGIKTASAALSKSKKKL